MRITRSRLLQITLIWGALFAALSATHFSPFGLLNIVGFPFLLFVPGYLTVLLFGFGSQNGAVKAALSVGFSLFELTFVGLVGNFLLPAFGNSHPLDMTVLLVEVALLVGLLLTLLWRSATKPGKTALLDVWQPIKFTGLDWFFALVPLAFVALAVLGAVTLNNGGGNAITTGMLVAMVGYLGGLVYYANRLRTNALVFGIFFFGLALLFMTSLRGWYITGHDIQHEFRLFLQTADASRWIIGNSNDAYNACLSITILPTVFFKLLDVQTFYIFKILFQIAFAFAPVLVLLINRNFVTKRVAVLATAYFMAFPTFFGDMPMLNRQEIALLFAGVGLLILFAKNVPLRSRRVGFYAMAIGVIESHYSTNYTLLVLLGVCAFGLPILRSVARKWKPEGRIYRTLNLSVWRERSKSIVTIPMVVILLGLSFLWSVQLTHSSGQLGKVLLDTIGHIRSALGDDAPDADAQFSYAEVDKLSDQQKLYRYFDQLVESSRSKRGASTFYDADAYSRYSFEVVTERTVPLTPLGAALTNAGVPVQTVNAALRSNLARFLQLMVVWGTIVVLFFKRYSKVFPQENRLFIVGSMLLMGAMLAIPVLLADYDLSRMLQQLLFLAGTVVVIGSMHILPKVAQKVRVGIASLAVLVMFTSTTGILTALLGGYSPQLHLYNSGIYYDLYYTHREERIGAAWLNDLLTVTKSTNAQTDNVFIDRYTGFKVQGTVQDSLNDVYPGIVRKSAYVFLGYTAVTKQQATAYFNGSLITYKYPLDFLDSNKDLIYNNGGSRVYK